MKLINSKIVFILFNIESQYNKSNAEQNKLEFHHPIKKIDKKHIRQGSLSTLTQSLGEQPGPQDLVEHQ